MKKRKKGAWHCNSFDVVKRKITGKKNRRFSEKELDFLFYFTDTSLENYASAILYFV